jgi:hypothetical protein
MLCAGGITAEDTRAIGKLPTDSRSVNRVLDYSKATASYATIDSLFRWATTEAETNISGLAPRLLRANSFLKAKNKNLSDFILATQPELP